MHMYRDEETVQAEQVAWRHLAYVRVEQRQNGELLDACYRLTARVEQLSARSALLDLGACTDGEALDVIRSLLARLARQGLCARAGLGPDPLLAQLALRAAPPVPSRAPILSVAPEAALSFLRGVSVAVLAQLEWPASTPAAVTRETVERLRRYGLHTLGHVARLDETALRRQFGKAGGALAALVAGREPLPLHPTPPAARLRFRLRFAPAASSERVVAALPPLAARIAARLRERNRCARELRLYLRWERGGVQSARLTLRVYSDDPALLAQELHRLLVPLLQPPGRLADMDAVEELRLLVRDFAPAVPEQRTFWRGERRSRQRAAAELAADTLARRHGHALLFSPRLTAPAAVLAEDRYIFAPPGTDDAPSSAMPRRERGQGVRDPWQQVPHHLHWW